MKAIMILVGFCLSFSQAKAEFSSEFKGGVDPIRHVWTVNAKIPYGDVAVIRKIEVRGVTGRDSTVPTCSADDKSLIYWQAYGILQSGEYRQGQVYINVTDINNIRHVMAVGEIEDKKFYRFMGCVFGEDGEVLSSFPFEGHVHD